MSYAIVFSSRTGNTALLAQTIAEALPQKDCLYLGRPDAKALDAEMLFVGFWTDKGSCDAEVSAFLKQLHGKKIFLFGTAGFGGSPAYFDRILQNVKTQLAETAEVMGTYMCQGKMPAAVRARYESMEAGDKQRAFLENFDKALSHPDAEDLQQLRQAVQQLQV